MPIVENNTETTTTTIVKNSSSTNQTPDQAPSLITYKNSKYNFSIQYPKDFSIQESVDYGPVLSIRVPTNYQKGTDFNVGLINISVSTSTAKCYTSNYANEAMTGIKVIGGKSFHYNVKQPFDDAAMGGQRGKESSFAIINNGLCYTIEKLIGYRDLRGFADGPYPPHFDEAKVNADLDSVIASFSFIATKVPDVVAPVACTMDAMQCPDGSYVGRTGPRCEFVCPVR